MANLATDAVLSAKPMFDDVAETRGRSLHPVGSQAGAWEPANPANAPCWDSCSIVASFSDHERPRSAANYQP